MITGGLLWLAMPLRPQLRGRVRIDPFLAPLALALAAFLTPYALDQLALQNLATTGHHSQNPHLFDMAWLSVTLIVLAVLAALLPAARSLVAWVAVSCLGFGVAGLAFGEGTTWSLARARVRRGLGGRRLDAAPHAVEPSTEQRETYDARHGSCGRADGPPRPATRSARARGGGAAPSAQPLGEPRRRARLWRMRSSRS